MSESDPNETVLESARKMFAGECTFLRGVTKIPDFPDFHLPEVAFAGRSNVGKSSLLNALTNRKTLARTSNTPGRTREINFFDLNGKLMLVDLPGYGYARASKQLVRQWTGLVYDYLKGRSVLRRTILLIDARHGIKDSDLKVMGLLDTAGVSYQAVLTKTDKITAAKLDNVLAKTTETLRAHTAAHPNILPTSSKSGAGIPELRAALAALAE
ncbi:MAG: ribosome biogenesis GTP-binding protein YihA/YsxC [Rhodospirillales bacterium]|jgi:GTP-binding protein